MRKISFDEEELLVIAVFSPDTRKKTAAEMDAVLPELDGDEDLRAILVSASEKLKRISDREYEELPLKDYRDQLAWEEEEDIAEDDESVSETGGNADPETEENKASEPDPITQAGEDRE